MSPSSADSTSDDERVCSAAGSASRVAAVMSMQVRCRASASRFTPAPRIVGAELVAIDTGRAETPASSRLLGASILRCLHALWPSRPNGHHGLPAARLRHDGALVRSTPTPGSLAHGTYLINLAFGTVQVHIDHQTRLIGSSSPTAGSGVGGPSQSLEFAPQALARPARPTHELHRWPGLRHDGRAVVHVAGRGDGGPDT